MPHGAPSEAKAAWLLRVLSIDVRRAAAPAATAAKPPGGKAKDVPGLPAWVAARSTAVQSLDSLEAAFRAMDEPEVAKAIILVAAIRANLTERPVTQRQVDELRRYITQDDIITEAEMPNGFGFTVALRAPLLAALAKVQPPE